ncbi:remodeling and spacing factor 1 [Anaeramoeba flamelloides]|uniref:Remodeling and spacing factor 1 n=1 Tax=Anaeramoeba flamelloides TaxID=1746091 RepID=A0ABQ8XQF4_9EUKA|nr:remodeling and spacing factor 1 [Anaeramoeba flamelloides]
MFQITHQGYLQKKSGKRKIYQKRHFRLVPPFLTYHNSESSNKTLGTLFLMNYNLQPDPENEESDYAFLFVPTNIDLERDYSVVASSERTNLEWFDKMKKAKKEIINRIYITESLTEILGQVHLKVIIEDDNNINSGSKFGSKMSSIKNKTKIYGKKNTFQQRYCHLRDNQLIFYKNNYTHQALERIPLKGSYVRCSLNTESKNSNKVFVIIANDSANNKNPKKNKTKNKSQPNNKLKYLIKAESNESMMKWILNCYLSKEISSKIEKNEEKTIKKNSRSNTFVPSLKREEASRELFNIISDNSILTSPLNKRTQSVKNLKVKPQKKDKRRFSTKVFKKKKKPKKKEKNSDEDFHKHKKKIHHNKEIENGLNLNDQAKIKNETDISFEEEQEGKDRERKEEQEEKVKERKEEEEEQEKESNENLEGEEVKEVEKEEDESGDEDEEKNSTEEEEKEKDNNHKENNQNDQKIEKKIEDIDEEESEKEEKEEEGEDEDEEDEIINIKSRSNLKPKSQFEFELESGSGLSSEDGSNDKLKIEEEKERINKQIESEKKRKKLIREQNKIKYDEKVAIKLIEGIIESSSVIISKDNEEEENEKERLNVNLINNDNKNDDIAKKDRLINAEFYNYFNQINEQNNDIFYFDENDNGDFNSLSQITFEKKIKREKKAEHVIEENKKQKNLKASATTRLTSMVRKKMKAPSEKRKNVFKNFRKNRIDRKNKIMAGSVSEKKSSKSNSSSVKGFIENNEGNKQDPNQDNKENKIGIQEVKEKESKGQKENEKGKEEEEEEEEEKESLIQITQQELQKRAQYQDQVIDELTSIIRKLQERYLDEEKISRNEVKLIKFNDNYLAKVDNNDPDAFLLLNIVVSIFLYQLKSNGSNNKDETGEMGTNIELTFMDIIKNIDNKSITRSLLLYEKMKKKKKKKFNKGKINDIELFDASLFFLFGFNNGDIIEWVKYFQDTNVLKKYYLPTALIYEKTFLETLSVVFSMASDLKFNLSLIIDKLKNEYIFDPENQRKLRIQNSKNKKENQNKIQENGETSKSSKPILEGSDSGSESESDSNGEQIITNSGNKNLQTNNSGGTNKKKVRFKFPELGENELNEKFRYNKQLFPIYKIIMSYTHFFENCKTSKKIEYASQKSNPELSKIIKTQLYPEIIALITYGHIKKKFLTPTRNHFWNYILKVSNHFKQYSDPDIKSFVNAIFFFQNDKRITQKKNVINYDSKLLTFIYLALQEKKLHIWINLLSTKQLANKNFETWGLLRDVELFNQLIDILENLKQIPFHIIKFN